MRTSICLLWHRVFPQSIVSHNAPEQPLFQMNYFFHVFLHLISWGMLCFSYSDVRRGRTSSTASFMVLISLLGGTSWSVLGAVALPVISAGFVVTGTEIWGPTCVSLVHQPIFGKWRGGGGYKYQYEGQASGQLTQQETRVRTCNLVASLRATARAQMTQNILTRTDRRIFLKSLLEVEIFH